MDARLVLLVVASAAWLAPASAATLQGSATGPCGMMLSCTTRQTCGSLANGEQQGEPSVSHPPQGLHGLLKAQDALAACSRSHANSALPCGPAATG